MSDAESLERERQTRKRRVDPRLPARGWLVVSPDQPCVLVPESAGPFGECEQPEVTGIRYGFGRHGEHAQGRSGDALRTYA
jgi:hypothetical protein